MEWLTALAALVASPEAGNLATAAGLGALVETRLRPAARALTVVARLAATLSASSSSSPRPVRKSASPSARRSRTLRKPQSSEATPVSPVASNDNDEAKLPF